MNYLGDFAQDSTVYMYLTTNDSNGGTVAPSGDSFTASDFFIHKNGSAVQKITNNGITVVSPFDSVVGVHSLTIDTSNDTGDSGFWNSGCDYAVLISPTGTIDSQIVAGFVGSFSIQNRTNITTAQVATELATYDGPTRAELTSDKEEILGSGNANWATYVNTESNAYAVAQRSLEDNQALTFSWPASGSTITGSVSLNNAAYTATSGSIAYLRTDGSSHLFTLGYNASDRTTDEGTARYKMADGTYTKYFTLRVMDTSIGASGIRSAIGMAAADLDDQLDEILSDAGVGARTVNVLVNDGTTPLENAKVRFDEGASTFIDSTSAAGSGTYNLDDATYDVSVTKEGYTYGGSTLVVSSSVNVTYSMTLNTITAPPNASTSTGVAHLYDHMGVKEVGAKASVQITSGPGGSGISYDKRIWTEISNSGGMVQFSGMIREATYDYWRGSTKSAKVSITVPDTLSFNLDEVIGAS